MVTLVYLWIIGCSEPDLRSPLLRLERSNLMCETFFFKLSRNQELEWDSGGPLFFYSGLRETVGYASWTSFDRGYTSGFDGPEKGMGDLPAGAGVKGGRMLSSWQC